MDDLDKEIREDLEYIANRRIIYKYLDQSGGIAMLQNSTLLFKNPKYFNDPYDCYEGLIGFDLVPDTYRQTVLRRNASILSPSQLREVTEALNTTTDEQMSGTYKNILMGSEISHVGICCLSENFDNLLMWSHYTGKHQGVCLGLDVIMLRQYIAALYPVLIKVKYSQTFKKEEFFVDHRKALSNCFKTKAELWEYEKEIRIVLFQLTLNEDHQFLLNIGREVITEVYLGSEMQPEVEQDIISICKESYPAARIYKMKLADNSFSLIPEEYHQTLYRL